MELEKLFLPPSEWSMVCESRAHQSQFPCPMISSALCRAHSEPSNDFELHLVRTSSFCAWKKFLVRLMINGNGRLRLSSVKKCIGVRILCLSTEYRSLIFVPWYHAACLEKPSNPFLNSSRSLAIIPFHLIFTSRSASARLRTEG